MSKRKRNSDTPIHDVGLGATVAFLQAQRDANSADDDGGWTKVGAPKKRRTEKKADDEPESFAATSKGTERATALPSRERKAPTVNPFSTKPQNSGDGREAASPPASPVRASSEERISRERLERKQAKKLERNYPAIEHSVQARLQNFVKINDLQDLVLYILADGSGPQWVSVRNKVGIKHVVTLLVPGLELDMFTGEIPLEASPSTAGNETPSEADMDQLNISPDDFYPIALKKDRLPSPLEPLADMFPHVWPVKSKADYNGNQYHRVHSPVWQMLTSMIPKTKEERDMKKSGHKGPLPANIKAWENKRTRISEFVASLADQEQHQYVVHPAWFKTPEAKEAAYQRRKAAHQTLADGWVESHVASIEDGNVPEEEIEEGSVTAGRNVYAVDCEMCKSHDDKLVLTRATLIDWDGNVVFDELVQPDVPIKDYVTQYSGITEEMLEGVTTTLKDIQNKLLEKLTPRAILLGHSLDSDLNALKFMHPFLIDTAILFPHVKGPPLRQSLKFLAKKYLNKEIQKGANGHDSIEDALNCLDLVKVKCERGPAFGTSEANHEPIFKRLSRAQRPRTSNAFRAGAVVDWGEPHQSFGAHAQISVGCNSDAEVVDGIHKVLTEESFDKAASKMVKADFVWGQLRELELARGWWGADRNTGMEKLRRAALERLGRGSLEGDDTDATGAELGAVVARTVDNIKKIYDSLPPCTAFIVYSGNGDERGIRKLQAMKQLYQEEYRIKNWDNLSVKWTDTEVQALSNAVKNARDGISFVTVK